jgi:hypothetical protein
MMRRATRFGTAQQIAFSDNPDDGSVRIDDGEAR